MAFYDHCQLICQSRFRVIVVDFERAGFNIRCSALGNEHIIVYMFPYIYTYYMNRIIKLL